LNARWYAASLVYIAEPVLWALLLLAFVMPWLLGLADAEMGARRPPFRGRGWAIFALVGIVAFWTLRAAEQSQARTLLDNAQVTSAPVKRVALEPYPINPFRWHAVLDTPEFFQTAEINALSGDVVSDSHRDTLYKPATTAATEAAKRTPLGQVYLDWGTWAVVRDLGPVAAPGMESPQLPLGRTWTTVEFDDLRFNYSLLGGAHAPLRTPLSGWVYIVDGREEGGESMHGREQHD
jgi:inner membrane protein